MQILLAGCGDIATRVAKRLSAKATFTGVRRDASKIADGIHAMGADFTQPHTLKSLSEQIYDYVVVSLTPSERSLTAYQSSYVEASQNLLAALRTPPKRVFYISSTSVYPQADHQWVDETSATTTESYGGILAAAEQVWLQSAIPATVLRLSGIYGDQRRYFLNAVRSGITAPNQPHYSNRIHVDDAARAIEHLILRDSVGLTVEACYNVSDKEPALLSDVVNWMRAEADVTEYSGEQLNRRGGSKRVSSRLLQNTGFEFLYPSFREGYLAMLGCED